mmetsp:Transcript_29000/g.54906  ORF Transcript_29000/g.54906 Transcript_29000/m.54906 type:complete len:418 (+) Transcript_29000:275-1528(+)|eukprot:CAMPEP_0201608878 /NCGR_PEP_ID=MMETSP0492-20130828/9420_1 /ASSEMBLY_ACC=CAM_ASM_000837 /TAXON_ID=420259 /ORGANISM="Thalassiosira gravida, Strain GMp14c1" /LENGTH=417 /DNA_ID=CAMNT_0048073915 /DNA_START=148 /DNA_END=1401 /DNA_ORIENTATION=+
MIQSPSETDSNPDKRRRLNDVSMDFFLDPLHSEDILLDGDLGLLVSEDAKMRLNSADFVKDILLPDTAMTAAANLEASNQSSTTSSSNGMAPKQEGKIGKLKAKLERKSTGDDLVPLNMSFRISSGNWIKEFEAESDDLVSMHPSLFFSNHPPSWNESVCATSQRPTSPHPLNFRTYNYEYEESEVPIRSSGCKPTAVPSLKNLRMSSSDWVKEFQDESVDLGTMDPALFMGSASIAAMKEQLSSVSYPMNSRQTHVVSPQQWPATMMPPLTSSMVTNVAPAGSPITSAAKADTSPSYSTQCKKKKKKKSRKRVLDETRVVEHTDGDVLSGRGGYTNSHPGNLRFRQKALEFRQWYEESSKEKKQEIADLLVDFVKNDGHRFLGKGKDGLWHEVIGNGPHYKASQALRERIGGRNDE